MTKIEETENVFFALGTALKAEGFKAIRFYRIRTRRQLFSVVGREDLRREEADDTMYSIEAVYEGNRCRIYTNHLEETENVIWMLQKTAKVYGEASGRAVCYISREWEQKTFCWDEPHMITETLRQVRKMAEESRMITHVSRCTYEQVCRDIQMVDEEMHMICDRDGYHCFTFGVVAEANGSRASTTDCIYGSHLSGMDVTSCVRRKPLSVAGNYRPAGIRSSLAARLQQNCWMLTWAHFLQEIFRKTKARFAERRTCRLPHRGFGCGKCQDGAGGRVCGQWMMRATLSQKKI